MDVFRNLFGGKKNINNSVKIKNLGPNRIEVNRTNNGNRRPNNNNGKIKKNLGPNRTKVPTNPLNDVVPNAFPPT